MLYLSPSGYRKDQYTDRIYDIPERVSNNPSDIAHRYFSETKFHEDKSDINCKWDELRVFFKYKDTFEKMRSVFSEKLIYTDPYDDVVVYGYPDLVGDQEGSASIIEFKTGQERFEDVVQVQMYAHALNDSLERASCPDPYFSTIYDTHYLIYCDYNKKQFYCNEVRMWDRDYLFNLLFQKKYTVHRSNDVELFNWVRFEESLKPEDFISMDEYLKAWDRRHEFYLREE